MNKIFAVDIQPYYEPAQQFATFGELVNVLVRNAFVLAGVLSFLLLIFGGFRVIVSAGSGDPKKLEEGRGAIIKAIIGLLIVVSSVMIIQVIETLTGYKLLAP